MDQVPLQRRTLIVPAIIAIAFIIFGVFFFIFSFSAYERYVNAGVETMPFLLGCFLFPLLIIIGFALLLYLRKQRKSAGFNPLKD